MTDHKCSRCGKDCDCMDFMFEETVAYENGTDPNASWYGDVIGTDIYDCIDCADCNENVDRLQAQIVDAENTIKEAREKLVAQAGEPLGQ